MRDLLVAINRSDLIECADVRTQAAVHAKDLLINQGRQSKAIKALDAVSPHTGITILSEAFVVEPIYLCNLSGLQT